MVDFLVMARPMRRTRYRSDYQAQLKPGGWLLFAGLVGVSGCAMLVLLQALFPHILAALARFL